MKQRNNVQVIRVPNRHIYQSIRVGRIASIPNRIQTYKNVRITTRRQSAENFSSTEKIDQIPRRVISLPNSINEHIDNVNDTIQSISITPIGFQLRIHQSFKDSEQVNEKKRNKKVGYYRCTPLCPFLSIVSLILISAVIVGIIIGLLPSNETTTSTNVRLFTTVTTTNLCSATCIAEQTCIDTVCINVGRLGCTLIWSRPGDGDIVVTTPTNKTIYYKNRGPSVNTSDGQLDRDDLNGTGPENVYWSSNSSLPPIGTYYLCFEPYDIKPLISIVDPITVTYHVTRPIHPILTLTRTFFNVFKFAYNCSPLAPTFVGNFTYP